MRVLSCSAQLSPASKPSEEITCTRKNSLRCGSLIPRTYANTVPSRRFGVHGARNVCQCRGLDFRKKAPAPALHGCIHTRVYGKCGSASLRPFVHGL